MQEIEKCDNCGTPLHGAFCSHCGQKAKSPVVSLWEFTSEALNGLFSVDSRIWRTIFPLLFQPGFLTREYLAGRRERYLPPFRTYLILSLLFFMVASILGTDVNVTVVEDPSSNDQQQSNSSVINEDVFSCQDIQIGNIEFLEDRARLACEKIQADSGSSLIHTLIDNIPMMMFFFIPFIALLVKVLYLFSHRKYVEHLLFLFHYHATFFLILSLIVIFSSTADSFPMLATPTSIIAALGWFYIPAYLLLAMRRVYCQGWFLTNIKFILLIIGYFITLIMALLVTMAYTALTL